MPTDHPATQAEIEDIRYNTNTARQATLKSAADLESGHQTGCSASCHIHSCYAPTVNDRRLGSPWRPMSQQETGPEQVIWLPSPTTVMQLQVPVRYYLPRDSGTCWASPWPCSAVRWQLKAEPLLNAAFSTHCRHLAPAPRQSGHRFSPCRGPVPAPR
jgi:hypothetical protein